MRNAIRHLEQVVGDDWHLFEHVLQHGLQVPRRPYWGGYTPTEQNRVSQCDLLNSRLGNEVNSKYWTRSILNCIILCFVVILFAASFLFSAAVYVLFCTVSCSFL